LIERNRSGGCRAEPAPDQPQTIELDRAPCIAPRSRYIGKLPVGYGAFHGEANIEFVDRIAQRTDRDRQLNLASASREGHLAIGVSTWSRRWDSNPGVGRVDPHSAGGIEIGVVHPQPELPATLWLDRDQPMGPLRRQFHRSAIAGAGKCSDKTQW